jgi:uncharacterized membrane protein
MPTLIAIGYQDETTAAAAGEEMVRLSAQLDVPPEAVAVLAVDPGGVYHATTRMQGTPPGVIGGSVFWYALFGALVFEPPGTPRSDAMRAAVEESAGARIGPRFAGEVRELLAPRASALFLLVDERDADLVLDALGRYGGRVRMLDGTKAGDVDGSGR